MSNQSKSRKYAQLLESAGRLFMLYGIKRVSVEEICRDAQVSKMTFYRYFNAKIDIARTMVSGMMEAALAEYQAIIDGDDPYPEQVTKIIRLKLEKSEDMSAAFVQDLMASPYPELRSLIEEFMSRNLEILREDFVRGQKDGQIRGDIKPEFLIYLINQMRLWALDPALAGLYSSTKDMTAEMVKFFFYGILYPSEGDK